MDRPDGATRARVGPARGLLLFLSLLCLLSSIATSLVGCVTRTARDSFIDRYGLEVDFIVEKKGFGKPLPKGHDHPMTISTERLQHILGAIEIETRADGGGVIRQPAFHPEILERTAAALSEAFAEVSPNEEISVMVVRKEMRIGILHRKFLTSFIAYMQDGYLRIDLSRADWRIPKNEEDERLPEPSGQPQTDFRVVSGEPLYYAGPGSLEIAWRDPVFRDPFRLPGSVGGRKVRREILEQVPVPASERPEADVSPDLDRLGPEQLRALADLEEDRRTGKITEADYQRARRELLRDR